MKPYGVPRYRDLESPDVHDIQRFAMQSHAGRIPNSSHVYKRYTRSTAIHRAIRRYWKKKARNKLRREMSKIDFLTED